MKMLSFTLTALAGAIGCALCASPTFAEPAGADSVDWSGPYVGLNTGWNSTHSQVDPGTATTNQLTGLSAGAGPVNVPSVDTATRQMDFQTNSWAGGGQVGFNHQMGPWVVGVEGDMDATGGHARQTSSYALAATALTTGSTLTIDRRTDPNWTATVRGRAGWATGRLLLYGTGGLAIANAQQSAFYAYSPTASAAVAAANPGAALGPFVNGGAEDRTLVGWTVGGGAEFKLSPAVSIGAEYRHSDYGAEHYGFGASAAGATHENPAISLADDQVLAKLNFHFGPGFGIFH